MKKYISSYRMFSAVRLWRHIALPLIVSAAGLIVSWLMPVVLEYIGAEESHLGGFIAGVFSGMIIVGPVMTVVIMTAVANAANPAAQGYKYFHSIADGAAHFKRAMITSAAMSACVILVWSGMVALYLAANGAGDMWIVCLFGWAILGLAELTAFIQQAVAKLLVFAPAFSIVGIISGILVAATEDSEEIPAAVAVVLLAVTLALFIGGNVNIIVNSERIWCPKAKEG